MDDLNGRVVVITGAGSGIGRATAGAFARQNSVLHLVDVDGDRAEETCARVREIGAHATAHEADCRDPAAIASVADAVFAAHGRVDVLHNNAGVGLAKPVEEMTLDDWRWVIDLNLYGVVYGVHHFAPRMIDQEGGGVVVNTASVAGLIGYPNLSAYNAAKFGVVGLSESLDRELRGRGVRVIAVCPGLIKTSILTDGRYSLPRDPGQGRVRAMFERLGAEPEVVADEIVAAVKAGRTLVVTPGHAKVMVGLHRVSRRLSRWFIERVGGP